MDEPAEALGEVRCPVRREAHDLVLVAIPGEPKVLGHSEVEEPERVGEEDPVQDGKPVPPSHGLRRAHEVPEPVDATAGGLLEWRHEEGARQVGRMVLDVVEAPRNPLGVDPERFRDRRPDNTHAPPVASPVRGESPRGPVPGGEPRLPPQVRPRVPRHGEVVHLLRAYPGHRQARPHRLAREPRPVLDPVEALLLDRSH